ncbi:MAG: twin-arginine translocase TatA/TatE family subunit [Anaerolineae bacterium]|jgi:Sec-independent protein translocase protein TatA|nr:twin-arginine translocase TatA/TatE family subunit [Anaerolineae bacterium]MBT7074449.1 twin-arginine translocase TatA/TatE family subunit [Anaerolineae bacterium]MBT7781940.1 twin-arginine translocase TatA/TatE family subunit [Anaerolineae bacterium]
MDILGIGIPELGFIVLIALIVLGPKDMQKAGKTIGKWMRKVVTSPEWREIKNASRQMKQLPTQLMREANLEDFEEYKRDLNITMPEDAPPKPDTSILDTDTTYGSWDGSTSPPKDDVPNSIAPPVKEEPAPAKPAPASPQTSAVKNYPSIEKKDA